MVPETNDGWKGGRFLYYQKFRLFGNVSVTVNLNQSTKSNSMKKLALILGCAALSLSLTTNSLRAADAKTYQVTGPVLEVNDGYIVVQKGEDKWQIAHSKSTKGAAVKVGDKVCRGANKTGMTVRSKLE